MKNERRQYSLKVSPKLYLRLKVIQRSIEDATKFTQLLPLTQIIAEALDSYSESERMKSVEIQLSKNNEEL